MQLCWPCCMQQVFFVVPHNATLRTTVAEVDLDPTSATVASCAGPLCLFLMLCNSYHGYVAVSYMHTKNCVYACYCSAF